MGPLLRSSSRYACVHDLCLSWCRVLTTLENLENSGNFLSIKHINRRGFAGEGRQMRVENSLKNSGIFISMILGIEF